MTGPTPDCPNICATPLYRLKGRVERTLPPSWIVYEALAFKFLRLSSWPLGQMIRTSSAEPDFPSPNVSGNSRLAHL